MGIPLLASACGVTGTTIPWRKSRLITPTT
jgi:hypothetical protein